MAKEGVLVAGWCCFFSATALVALLLMVLAAAATAKASPQGGQHQGAVGAGAVGPPGHPPPTPAGGGVRRGRGWREWHRGDPSLINSLRKSKTPLGNAEVYIVLALLIGVITVVIGCWLSDNCWSPEPEHRLVTAA